MSGRCASCWAVAQWQDHEHNDGLYLLSPTPSNLGRDQAIFCVFRWLSGFQRSCSRNSKAHVVSLWEMTTEEYSDAFALVRQIKDILQEQFNPQGFNIGMNCGLAAGQSIFHAHIHLIPRYTGDVPSPRGGIRNVILIHTSSPFGERWQASQLIRTREIQRFQRTTLHHSF